MTQELYQKAMKFAGEKHFNQIILDTHSSYLVHISNVAMEILVAYNHKQNFNIDLAIQIAILHDTIEDTTADFNEIKNEFGEQVATAVQALTKDKSLAEEDRMVDCLNRINELPKEIGIVKLADRITNLQTPPKSWTKEKIINYCAEAKLISETLSNKNEYLNNRLVEKIQEYELNTFII